MCDYHQHKPPECATCPLYHQPGPVFGEGTPSTARLVYIAQNPGREEVAARPMRPLIGPSGNVFNRQLAECGIARKDLFITNQVKCLTPDNREPSQDEIEHCQHLLAAELLRCRADTVVLAGAVAFNANIGDYSTLSPDYHPTTSLFERMGCVEQKDDRKWIATLHPAHVMRFSGTSSKEEALLHLRKAWTIAGVKIPLPRVIEHPTPGDVQRHKDAARTNKIFADDVESFPPEDSGEASPLDISDEDYAASEAWTMDICGFSAINYEAIILATESVSQWADIWADAEITQCEHNGESDRFYLEQIAPQRNARFDTMLAHHMLHNNERKFLKPHTLRYYTNLPYYNRDLEKQVGRRFYCGMDNIATLLAAKEQIRQMKADVYVDVWGTEGVKNGRYPGRLWHLYNGTAFPGEPGFGRVLPILEEQRRVGIRVDLRQAAFFKLYCDRRIAALDKQIESLIGPFFNWRSYAPGGDVQTLFYTKWRLPRQYIKDPKTHRQKVTCNDEARKHLAEWINDKPERRSQYSEAAAYFDLVNEISSITKIREYIDRISPDRRIHAMQKAHGTANFRLSSKPNTQNFPDWPVLRRCVDNEEDNFHGCGRTHPGGKLLTSIECCGHEMGAGMPSIRSIVIPDHDDDLLLVVDFDQVELWTYVEEFDIKYLRSIQQKGEYVYGVVYEDVVGKQFFKPGLPRIKKNMTDAISYGSLREAKAIPLGFQGGMQGEKIASRQGWTVEKGNFYYKQWQTLNPELYRAHDWIRFTMQQSRRLRIPPGWLLHYPSPDLQGLNAFGSAPAAALLWTSMILIDEQFKRRQLEHCRVSFTVHDSLVMNVGHAISRPEIMRQVYEEIVAPVLGRPIPWLHGFKYKFSATVGRMWDWKMQDYPKWAQTALRQVPV